MSSIQSGMPLQTPPPVTANARPAPEASRPQSPHDHLDTLSSAWMSHRTDAGLKEAMAGSNGFNTRDQLLAQAASDGIAGGRLHRDPEQCQGEYGVHRQRNVTITDAQSKSHTGDLTLHTQKRREAPYNILDIKHDGKGLSRPLFITPMNSDHHLDVKRCIADHLPAGSLMSLSRTNKTYKSLFYEQARLGKTALSQAGQMARVWQLPLAQRQAAATAAFNGIKNLRKADEDRKSEALFAFCEAISGIPQIDDRLQLVRDFFSALQEQPSSDALVRIIKMARIHWLPMEERKATMNDIVFPLLKRLINDGAMPSAPENPLLTTWALLTLLPADMQADAKGEIDVMVDAMSARGTPIEGLPWDTSARPDLSIQARVSHGSPV